MSKSKVNFYVNSLDHLHPFIAAKAAAALGDLGDEAALQPLIVALNHTVPEVRRAAATSLGKLGDKRAIAPLRALIGRDTTEDTFWTAVEALVRLGDDQARALVVDALLQGDDAVRERAIAVVGSTGDSHLLDPLRGITEDPDGRITRVLANALSALDQHRNG